MSKEITGIVTWLKGWFFDKDDITSKEQALQTQINNKASVTDLNTTNGNVSSLQSAMDNKVDKVTGKGLSTNDYTTAEKNKLAGIEAQANKYVHPTGIGTSQTSTVFKKIKYDAQGHITGTADVTGSDLPSHNHSISNITNLQTELDSLTGRLDNLESIKAIQVVTTLPTASSSTMNRLYIVSENSKINVYYTTQSGSNYSWHKMDADILDELNINWADILNNPFSDNTPSDFATASHKHGFITNEGILLTGSQLPQSNSIVITDASGIIKGTANISTVKVQSANDYSNIGTDALDTQNTINSAIDSKIGILQSEVITSIVLVPKATDSTGKIIFYTGDEPT